jgi:hypothetical protein
MAKPDSMRSSTARNYRFCSGAGYSSVAGNRLDRGDRKFAMDGLPVFLAGGEDKPKARTRYPSR